MADCGDILKDLVDRDLLDDKQVKQIVDEVESSALEPDFDRRFKKLKLDRRELVSFLTLQKVQQKISDARINRTLEGLDINTKRQAMQAIDGFIESSGTTQAGGKASFVNNERSVKSRLYGAKDSFFKELDDNVLDEPELSKDVFEAVDMLNKGESIQGKPQMIRDAANAIKRMNKYLIDTTRDAGMFIKERADYIIRQTHNREAITKVGFEEWSNRVQNLLDVDRTFDGATTQSAKNDILETIYNDIVNGEYGGAIGTNLQQRRTLHFKDGVSFHEYFVQFGDGSINDVINKSINSTSRAIALNRTFGPNAKQSFRNTVEKIQAKLPRELRKELDFEKNQDPTSLAGAVRRREATMFRDAIASESMVAKAINFSRDLQAMSKLGAAVLSTPTDFALATTNFMAKTGQGYLKTVGGILNGYAKALNPKQKKEFGKLLGILADTETSINRFDGEKLTSKFTSKVMKLTGLEYVTSMNRTATGIALGQHLASLKKLSFDKLDPRLQAEMKAFNISPKEWDLIKTATNKDLGLEILSPEALFSKGGKANFDLGIKLANFIGHNSRFGAIEAGLRARSLTTWGLPPDSVGGASLRALMQFKTFSLEAKNALVEITSSNPAVARQSYLKQLRNKDNLQLFGTLAAQGFVLAGIGLWARDLAAGKTPRNLATKDNVFEMLSRGVYPLEVNYLLDSLKGDYAKYGRSLFKDIAGPTFGQLEDLASFIGKPQSGKAERLLRNNIPLATNPLINVILRKSFLDGLNNEFNPQYYRRVEKKLRENGQDYFIDAMDPRR